MDLEKKDRLGHLIAMAMNRDGHLIDEVFLQVYGDSFDKWILHAWNVSDETFAADSPETKRFLDSFDQLIAAFKVRLHQLIDEI